eukprot:TRINITY_DN2498_c0_g1_i1.p1 TRINITY_DN2498_c0_g1~~TRINITY_DN2498_c0_g1_i1.p1  ORF type:complete len:111 (-),score=23.02 TRINITY_DN2498_c0_g1_i1:532-864(-)
MSKPSRTEKKQEQNVQLEDFGPVILNHSQEIDDLEIDTTPFIMKNKNIQVITFGAPLILGDAVERREALGTSPKLTALEKNVHNFIHDFDLIPRVLGGLSGLVIFIPNFN